MSKPEILVIDDEPQIQKLLSIILESNGYKVINATNGLEGNSLAASIQPDLILLDIGLPDKNGIMLLRDLKQWYPNPILILSVVSNEEDIISALDFGADDYITKPFRSGELLARIRTALKRKSKTIASNKISRGNLSIDFEARSVFQNGISVKLTATEYNLLSLFIRNEGKVLTHSYLLREVWGTGYQTETQYLRVFVAQLRKKIEFNPDQPKYIITESGVGYRFVTDSE